MTLNDTASGHQGMTVVAGPRIILGVTTNDPLWATPLDTSTGDTHLALYVQAEQSNIDNNGNSGPTRNRKIHWNSDVVIYAGPSPLLIIGPDGKVLTSVNITANGVVNPAPGNALSGPAYVEVNDLTNDDSGNVWMQSLGRRDRRRLSGRRPLLGHLLDARQLAVRHDPQPLEPRPRDRQHRSDQLRLDRRPTGCPNPPRPRVKENAPGGSADAKFSIVRQVDPTLITITNDDGTGPKLVINGFIDNRIGETDITNVFGPITSTTIRGGSSSFYNLVHEPALEPDPLEHRAPLRRHEHRRSEQLRVQPRQRHVPGIAEAVRRLGEPVRERRPDRVGEPPAGAHDVLRDEHVPRPEDDPARLAAAEPARDDAGDRDQVDGGAATASSSCCSRRRSSGCRPACRASTSRSCRIRRRSRARRTTRRSSIRTASAATTRPAARTRSASSARTRPTPRRRSRARTTS